MQDECELRVDVPLPAGATPKQWETAWRRTLAEQKLTAVAVPPAQALGARYRVCGGCDESLRRYLPARLAALPGGPMVLAELESVASEAQNEWRGVHVWLSFAARDMPALMAHAPRKVSPAARFRVRKG